MDVGVYLARRVPQVITIKVMVKLSLWF